MRWPWSKPEPEPVKSEGTRAREQAEADLAALKGQREEVSAISKSLYAARMKNHFGDNLVALIENGRRS